MNALRFMPLVAVLACAHACVNNAPPSPPGGFAGTDGTGGFDGGGGTGGTGGAGATGGAGGTGGQPGTGGAGGGTPSTGACDNPDVLAALTTLSSNSRQVSANCALLECQLAFAQGEQAFIACVDGCVEREIPGLSTQCAACYGELEWCNGSITQLCWTECANTPCDSGCLECGEPGCSGCALQCRNQLDVCTGRMSTDCDV